MRFAGTEDYVATDDLTMAVNAAIVLERPLLVKGEPAPARRCWPARSRAPSVRRSSNGTSSRPPRRSRDFMSTTRAALRDSQLGDRRVHDIANYIRRGKLWEAFTADERPVLLIDEIDKADIEFPTTCCRSWIAWNSSSTKPARR